MAALVKISSSILSIVDTKLGFLLQKNVQIISSAKMSQYPKYFVEPMYRTEEQNAAYESGQAQERVLVPCRAPLSEQTSSEFYNAQTKKFINHIMRKGKKVLARELVEKAFEVIKKAQIEKFHSLPTEKRSEFVIKDPNQLLHEAVQNSKPIMILTPIKRGGVKYQVPVPVADKIATVLAYKWLIDAGKEKDRTARFHDKLAWEIMDAANNTGRVVKRKLDLHKQCETNRAYAHYRWS
ncbi:small ribosomal subunit protein uS7m [Neocloeon triangulifer]|uniref:small ribosomal subunit protein uS7m n=1 Tax=Neocloeon triangulifer TaxID=2078957 RepID=UPI00286EFA51|nr:small ribosomal subunit protein uS7m [Neocloeon triangulifer]